MFKRSVVPSDDSILGAGAGQLAHQFCSVEFPMWLYCANDMLDDKVVCTHYIAADNTVSMNHKQAK